MKPNFALDLSHEGIVLLHRSPRNTWTEVGEIALDDPNFRENLGFLRSTAVGLEGKGFATKLLIPESQVLFTEIDAPGPTDDERKAQIEVGLVGLTPYDVADVVFDWRQKGDIVEVAVIAKETLDEAEEFTIDHRLNPLCFSTLHEDDDGLWEATFGCTDYAVSKFGANPEDWDQWAFFTGNPMGKPEDEIPVRPEPIEPEDEVPEPTDEAEEFEPKEEVVEDEGSEEPDQPTGEDLVAKEEEAGVPEETVSETVVSEVDQTEEAPDGTVDPDAGEEDSPKEPNASAAFEAAETEHPVADEIPAFASRRQGEATEPAETDDRPIDRIESRIQVTQEIDDTAAPALTGEMRPLSDKEAPVKPSILSNLSAVLTRIKPKLAGVLAAFIAIWLKTKSLSRRLISKPSAVASGLQTRFTRKDTPAAETPEETPELVKETADLGFPAMVELGERQSKRRRIVVLAAAVVLLGLLGSLAGYFLLTTGDETIAGSDPNSMIENASLPTDDVTGSLRPEPRSKLEGQDDPDAGQPDTVDPVTELTQQELEDIRAAGLPDPTDEEIAESDGSSSSDALTEDMIAELYSTSGILQGVSDLLDIDAEEVRGDIFVASVDRALAVNDAFALQDFTGGPDDVRPFNVASPVAAGLTFDLDENGLVRATRDGALNPEGILVLLGKPSLTPPEKPETEQEIVLSRIAKARPKARPEDLKTGEDAIFVQGRLTLSELRKRKPKDRPQSEQALLAAEAGDISPTELAVLTSFQPTSRPDDFEETVEKTRAVLAALTPADTPIIESGPVIPTRASVAKLATQKNAINRSKLNLIGVYGTNSKRRALLRLPSGRYVKVEIGDRIDGGRIAAIGDDTLSYVKSGRNRVLKVPN